ncbi:type III-A CRISPR-associated RAMP protein Csm3 [Chloroflexus sp.]|uniref:type III-A CRISPR-associated RAMP protein Csm3 n=1 Tax=Chloroflexus sp. TaxID=1904827 RepID=UPI00298F3762|nr:type III-A CRISPR-associated RAMP protein Csm3 [Chloroflexus sp.]MDW8404970.1 type III-A CRISPR-associated RAMP protein Csm3 [Chloroflexus sp.]
MKTRAVTLHGRIFLRANIELLTGLHIGGAAGGLEIGGLDKPVIRNPRNNQPYIPGSSLKGKLRSLMEKVYGAPQTFRVNEGVYVHVPTNEEEYRRFYSIAGVFGTLPNHKDLTISIPTRLAIRDVPLTPESEQELRQLRTDLPYTEIKWEAAIDRVTSAAAPRQIERVPAGAVFGPAEAVYSVYAGAGETVAEVVKLFGALLEAFTYLEDDYLGGMGSRGNGQVRLCAVQVAARRLKAGQYGDAQPVAEANTLRELDREQVIATLQQIFAE